MQNNDSIKNKPKGRAVAAVLWWKNSKTQQDEILMSTRHRHLRVFPGYTAFLGGKVDKEDHSLTSAIIREIKEEVQLEVGQERLKFIGVATTPAVHPYRFETSYYLVKINDDEKHKVDNFLNSGIEHEEFSSSIFSTVNEHLERYKNGMMLMVPLVRFYLEDIFNFGIENAKMLDFNEVDHASHFYPLEMQSNIMQLFIPSKTLPPHLFTNCFLINADLIKFRNKQIQKVVLVDPSPKDESTWEKMIHVLEDAHIIVQSIFCTHHHIDHCSYLDKTVQHYKVPLYIHKDTVALGKNKNEISWEQLTPWIKYVGEGDYITEHWLEQRLKVSHIPGHAKGQIALTTDRGHFFIAGDLFQSEGSVVIGGKGSSMSEYMNSLKMLLDMNPFALYPSHGVPVGSISPIKKLLEHRILRHKQIVNYLSDNNLTKEYKNFSTEEIQALTTFIYEGLPKELEKLARANIESHLKWNDEMTLDDIFDTYQGFH